MAKVTTTETRTREYKVVLSQQDLIDFALERLDIVLEDGDCVDIKCKGFELRYYEGAEGLLNPIIERKRAAALGAIMRVTIHE